MMFYFRCAVLVFCTLVAQASRRVLEIRQPFGRLMCSQRCDHSRQCESVYDEDSLKCTIFSTETENTAQEGIKNSGIPDTHPKGLTYLVNRKNERVCVPTERTEGRTPVTKRYWNPYCTTQRSNIAPDIPQSEKCVALTKTSGLQYLLSYCNYDRLVIYNHDQKTERPSCGPKDVISIAYCSKLLFMVQRFKPLLKVTLRVGMVMPIWVSGVNISSIAVDCKRNHLFIISSMSDIVSRNVDNPVRPWKTWSELKGQCEDPNPAFTLDDRKGLFYIHCRKQQLMFQVNYTAKPFNSLKESVVLDNLFSFHYVPSTRKFLFCGTNKRPAILFRKETMAIMKTYNRCFIRETKAYLYSPERTDIIEFDLISMFQRIITIKGHPYAVVIL